MTRAYAILTMMILISTPLAGCLDESVEEIVDDILGCMDENAENYLENATSELVGDCIYLVSMEVFMSAMDNSDMGIEDMLNQSSRAGYSMTMSTSGYNEDMGMDMDMTMIERVLVDMDRDAVLVQTSISSAPMMVIDYTHIQVGEVVNIHFSVGGMMAAQAGGADSGAYLVRDSTPNVMEIVHSMIDSDDMDDEDDINGDGISDECPFDWDNPSNPCGAQECSGGPDNLECQNFTADYCENNDDDGCGTTFTMICYNSMTSEVVDDIMNPEDCEDAGLSWVPVTVDGGDDMDIPEDAIISITYEADSNSHVMTMSYVEEDMDTTVTVNLDGNKNLMSYSTHGANDTSTVSMEYIVMWDDAVVIEVDETLPRNSIPVHLDIEGEDEFVCDSGEIIHISQVDNGWEDCYDGSDEPDNGSDDEVVFVCDNGEEIEFAWVNDGYPDCYDESDEATYEEGEGGEPNFADILDCTPFVESSAVGDENPSELWDGTNLDMTECDGEASEYYTDYVVGDTAITAPYSMTVWESEEGWSEMTGDSTGEMCEEYDGSYDADNDVCSMVYALVRNDTHILYPEGDWADDNDDPDGEMCEEYEGSYDADEDICWFTDGEIVDGDGGVLVMDLGDGDELSFYQYDSTTGSGVMLEMMEVFICDNGELVAADEYDPYDDGWENCEDGSDEPGQGEETSEFTCMDGTVIPFSGVNDWFDDCPDGSDEMWYYEGGDDDDGDDPMTPLPVITAFVADNQTLNAPVSDFELHFLSDCDPIYNEETGAEEMPNLNDCTVEFSIPLTGGETDDGVMLTYTDHDADGLVSPGDELTLDWGDYDGDAEPEVYDTWASEYSAQSPVTLEPLPGFGALLAVIGMLGAVLIRVESRNED
jgi:hypothetical protein